MGIGQAIRHLGGFMNAARVMRFRTARQPRSRWKDFAAVVAELRLYIDAQPEARRGAMPTNVELLQVRESHRLSQGSEGVFEESFRRCQQLCNRWLRRRGCDSSLCIFNQG